MPRRERFYGREPSERKRCRKIGSRSKKGGRFGGEPAQNGGVNMGCYPGRLIRSRRAAFQAFCSASSDSSASLVAGASG